MGAETAQRPCGLAEPTPPQLIEDLRKQLEHLQLFKLEAEQRRGRSSSAGLQEYHSRTRESELEQEVRRLKQVRWGHARREGLSRAPGSDALRPLGQPQPEGAERRAQRADHQPEHSGRQEPLLHGLLGVPGRGDQLSLPRRGNGPAPACPAPPAGAHSPGARRQPCAPSTPQLMDAIQKQEEINFRLQDYIDRIIVAIMETNPSILEVK